MEFTKSTGTVIRATAQMKTKIAGHAIIRLIFPTDTGSHYSLYTRAMIVEDLQGPIYLGQDIFQATHIFHSLTPTHMIMSIGRNTYRTPYIRSRRDRPIARLQPSDGRDQETPSVSINHTEHTDWIKSPSPSSRQRLFHHRAEPGPGSCSPPRRRRNSHYHALQN